MRHPDSYLVGPLGLAMCGLAMLFTSRFAIALGFHAHRFLPTGRSRTTYWTGMVLMFPLAVTAFILSPTVFKALAVIASFGWNAYDGGLRVVNKHGQLSDGGYLNVFWAAVHGVGPVVVMMLGVVPVVVWYMHFHPRAVTKPPAAV